jgi:hypothetical protein
MGGEVKFNLLLALTNFMWREKEKKLSPLFLKSIEFILFKFRCEEVNSFLTLLPFSLHPSFFFCVEHNLRDEQIQLSNNRSWRCQVA